MHIPYIPRRTQLIAMGLSSVCAVSVAWAAEIGSLQDEARQYRRQGYTLQQQGKIDEAVGLYQKAAALDPTYATPHNDLGILFEQKGWLKRAEQEYLETLRLDRHHLAAHANLALLYEQMDKTEAAAYHWMQRYKLGDARDPWTVKAEERLVALGVLKDSPQLKGKLFGRRKLIEHQQREHQDLLTDFDAVTSQSGPWPSSGQ